MAAPSITAPSSTTSCAVSEQRLDSSASVCVSTSNLSPSRSQTRLLPGSSRTVVLLRSPSSSSDRYLETLVANHYDVVHLPVLEFVFLEAQLLGFLVCLSSRLHLVMGCIFTSSQALRAWQRVRSQASFPADLVCLYSRPCYVVGQATARLARTIGFVDVRGEHSGSARVLGDLLVDQCTVDRSLVDEVSSPGYIFICAEGRRDDLPQIVTEAGIKLYECVGYRTRSLSVDCKELADLVPCTVVFYSPSGVKAFPVCSECDHGRLGAVVGGRACCAPKLSEPVLSSGDSECALCLLASDGVQIVAIGPTTAAALKDANLLVAATCSQPTPTALLDALRSLQPE
eukprot:CAMPEP_0177667364 /NCGR_PEP_ID=MMETSP0447-20121125/22084_1 /TAXON_ID=0 /ORGANISM="Stygamoeba regulata, Strain BSH-02190019" /LENGTH=342 /DNA_ID=CAMNT_0019173591 /DNA_START=108 /DNA_END=1136 /DNA_ORIENTATION=+